MHVASQSKAPIIGHILFSDASTAETKRLQNNPIEPSRVGQHEGIYYSLEQNTYRVVPLNIYFTEWFQNML